jgi:hypothetical protein
MTETGGVGVLEIEEPVVRHKAQASSGRVGGSGGGKVVATGEETDGVEVTGESMSEKRPHRKWGEK